MSALACPHCGQLVAIPDGGQAGQRFRCPRCRQRIVLEQKASEPKSRPNTSSLQSPETAPLPADWIPLDPPADKTQSAKPKLQNRQPREAEESTSPDAPPDGRQETLSALGAGGAIHALTTPGIAPAKRGRRVGRYVVPVAIAVGLLLVTLLFVWDHFTSRNQPAPGIAGAETSKSGTLSAPKIASREPHKSSAPTSVPDRRARPIRLLLAPAGVRIVVHLRPAELWNATTPASGGHLSRGDELRRCLGPLATWAEGQIAATCLFPPGQIDEVLFALVLRSPGDPPDVAATVWLKQAAPAEEIAKRFGGQKTEKGKLPTWINGDRALVIRDGKTFAVGPQSAAQEMADASDDPNPTDESIEELLKQTDRDCQMTFVFRPDDLDRFCESFFPTAFQETAHRVARWLDPEATEGAVVSFRLDDPFRVRLALRSRPTVGVHQLEEAVQRRLDRLPKQMLADVETLNPQTSGRRKLVGRVPAMWKAVVLGIQSTTESRLATFESVLPERAAPNLSLGMLLALTEPHTASGSRGGHGRGGSSQKETVAERLATKVDVDFRRTPLSDAFASIGEDIGVTFEIDGRALKVVGYTKNMAQTVRLSGVPATEALRTILKPYPKMALVVDEPRQAVIVTTSESAEAKGQKPLALEK